MMQSMGMPIPPGMTPERMQQAMQAMGMGGGMGGLPGMGGMPGMGGLPGMPPMGGGGGMPGFPGMDMDPEDMEELMGLNRGPAAIFGNNTPSSVDFSRWATFYPNYIDSSKTNADGRRIPKSFACDKPIVDEMGEVCRYFQLKYVIEPYKRYSRDATVQGRVRVKLTDNGSFLHHEIHTRKDLMLKMGELIPKLQIRTERLAKELEAAKATASGPSTAASSSTASKKKGKKKGKR
ncbi:hypothetical protein DYB25_000041 [Aphanomyces astaci]|uniref:Signal recognition particle 19 kDa protein n=1 Tax=Aphanomyces astaci TaxID=112090 RepID=A0A397BFS2_APHAT|nr:hypothetical protein DYB36_004424 [Aphanomyces astaci]RHY19573.1 hypothetical protein DYB25_000041 [Aphanomyces astaci]RHY40030.1 hypothetical protein DYB38_002205 [Aphanomyces astaci]RHY43623.1 hypothetical protein DYB34_001856 [Aphanomyces astaci]RHY78560.1 hypothetical protein DYB30_000048 [Aphanomyces astaci]